MNTITLSQFIQKYDPVTTLSGIYSVYSSNRRIIENTDVRLLENGEVRITEEEIINYPIVFDLRDINRLLGHIIDKQLWTVKQSGESYMILSGLSNSIDASYIDIGYIVTEIPYKGLICVSNVILN